TSAGDAIALAVTNMAANESAASLSGAQVVAGANVTDNSISYSRSRKCYDVNGDPVVGCSPLSSVITIVTHVQLDGSRTGANDDATKTWAGGVHRVSDDSLTRVFTNGTETQRIHNDNAMAHDTTNFTSADRTRFFAEGARDSVKAVTFNVPRSVNPFPVSGSIVRTDTVHVVLTKGGRTETRDVMRRVEVTFPPDAQGNVQLKVNASTCNLNLVTHKVTSCT
ncbi:MAG TPA: hypothetical protein VF483_04745, partial [Gemmatimonadaceae bacterium]